MNRSDQLDAVFGALADPIRRDMLARLAKRPRTAGELGEPFAISQPAASKHIATLERAGLVTRSVKGRVHRFQFRASPLRDAQHWITRHHDFWERSLDRLEQVLDDLAGGRS